MNQLSSAPTIVRRRGQQPIPLAHRLAKYSRQNGSCIEWTGHINKAGYGRIAVNGVDQNAHRVAYEHHVGPVPCGLVLDHLCRNRRCINPEHLEPVTPRTNTLRGTSPAALNAKKTHCINGHPLSGDNLIIRKTQRECRTCSRASWRKYHQNRALKIMAEAGNE